MSQITTNKRSVTSEVTYRSKYAIGAKVVAATGTSPTDGKPTVTMTKYPQDGRHLRVNGQPIVGLMQHMNPADAKAFGLALVEIAEGLGA